MFTPQELRGLYPGLSNTEAIKVCGLVESRGHKLNTQSFTARITFTSAYNLALLIVLTEESEGYRTPGQFIQSAIKDHLEWRRRRKSNPQGR